MLILLLLTISFTFGNTVFEKLNEKLENLYSIRASFIQETVYSWYPKPEISKGKFFARKDKKFRIEYTEPDKVIIVSDGKKIIILNLEEREAFIDHVENNTSPVIEALFLFSRPLNEVFRFIEEKKEEKKTLITLIPIERDENVKEAVLEVGENLKILSITVVDHEGTITRIIFKSLEENVEIPDEVFKIRIPPDVRIRSAVE